MKTIPIFLPKFDYPILLSVKPIANAKIPAATYYRSPGSGDFRD